jgi:hypothetical protein
VAGRVLATAALAAACAAGGSTDGGQGLAFETILDEAYSGLSEPLREVVRDEEAWARLWERVYAGVTPRPPRPAVDFSRHMLIAVATGTRPTGGFDVAVRAVAVRDAVLEVEVVSTCPGTGARVSMALTQPVEVVRLDKVAQTATFRETRAASCR